MGNWLQSTGARSSPNVCRVAEGLRWVSTRSHDRPLYIPIAGIVVNPYQVAALSRYL